jgi:predicted DNA-binding ribbon-helix-helix protein
MPSSLSRVRPVSNSWSEQIKVFPTSIRLTQQLRDSLKRRAKERRWSLTMLIVQVLEAWDRAEQKKEKR